MLRFLKENEIKWEFYVETIQSLNGQENNPYHKYPKKQKDFDNSFNAVKGVTEKTKIQNKSFLKY